MQAAGVQYTGATQRLAGGARSPPDNQAQRGLDRVQHQVADQDRKRALVEGEQAAVEECREGWLGDGTLWQLEAAGRSRRRPTLASPLLPQLHAPADEVLVEQQQGDKVCIGNDLDGVD